MKHLQIKNNILTLRTQNTYKMKQTLRETIKIFLFIELITLMVCGLTHIFVVIFSEKFPLEAYPIMIGIVLFIFLFTTFIVEPLHNWFFD